jgi:MerR family transcriptional regulator, light-induced transcriptional regulator
MNAADDAQVGPGMGGTAQQRGHPIGVVARRTGLSLHVLRAWERRYGVVRPVRTEGGQRLYSDADIARLRLLRQLTEAGRSISQVASLTLSELERHAEADVRAADPVGPAAQAEEWRSQVVAAGARMDGARAYATLLRAAVSLRPLEYLSDVLLPVLVEVGEKWHARELSPAQEHVVSAAARRVLSWQIDAYVPPPDAPMLLTATVDGELHEFGALLVTVLGLEAGWRVSYLGASLPAAELAHAARGTGASVVALSLITSRAGDHGVGEVETLRRGLHGVRVLLGGSGAVEKRQELEALGAIVIPEPDKALEFLRLERQLVERR